jgi:ParB family chromosome partitioning protein
MVPLGVIKVDREQRQRRKIDPTDLIPSIKLRGIMNPLIVDSDWNLIAGERRYAAAREIGLAEVPVRMTTELTPEELQIIELEENIKREQLDWKDAARAAQRIHQLFRLRNPQHSQEATAEAIGMDRTWLVRQLAIARELDKPHSAIAQCTGMKEAYNVITRKQEREKAAAFEDLLDDVQLSAADILSEADPDAPDADRALDDPLTTVVLRPTPKPSPQEEVIINESFLDWAPQYSGPKFNFIHFDPPYGIDFASGPQGKGADGETIYDDGADVFTALLHCLCQNLDRLMAQSGHLMVWYSVRNQPAMMEIFAQYPTKLSWQIHPLIWLKSDNAGISFDSQRVPRHIYETALIGVRGDHKLVKTKADAYASQSDRRLHPSTKPEAMLRHFFEMFVDEHTRMLDPTCGSGSSLRAADSLRAKSVFGLEISPDYYASARAEFQRARALRNVEI